jgi:hypothetical protein
MSPTTSRLWVITTYVSPCASRFIRFRIPPWTETASPAVGSSAITSFGDGARARATPTRRP